MFKINATAQIAVARTTGAGGIKLTATELERQAKSTYVGKVEIEIVLRNHSIRFNMGVFNGTERRYVAWPKATAPNGNTYTALEVSSELKPQIEALALRTMREAIGRSSNAQATVQL
jgi:hypothetical protein